MAKKKSNKPQKGVAGKGTGGKTRKEINDASKKGFTLDQIARAGMRSPDTISSIRTGDIKNPPSDLSGKIKKGLVGKKPKNPPKKKR